MAQSSSSVVIRFVCTGCTAASELMQKAFKAVGGLGECVWFTSEQCLSVKNKDRQFVYVFDDFAGDAFRHIVATGNRVYGPTCILHCLNNSEALPKLTHPVYSKSMEKIVISCTSISGQRRDALHERVQWMLGEASKDFHDRVSHLVAGEVGSKKYIVAAQLGKSIVTPEWVDAVWDTARFTFQHATDAAYEKYRCPIFKGFVVCVSGMASDDRNSVRSVVEQNGGRYSGEMKINECTHLVLTEAKGQKYEFAVKWNINIVSPKWLNDSVKAGYSLPESNYRVVASASSCSELATSTPTNDNSRVSASLVNVSAISTTHINDTALTTQRDTSISCAGRLQSTDAIGRQRQPIIDLDSIDLSSATREPFLDGCRIYVAGITGSRLEKVRKIINRGGGTRYNQINDSVTHVIVDSLTEDIVSQLKAASVTARLHVVSVRWLVECLKQSRTVSEADYICFDNTADTDAAAAAAVLATNRRSDLVRGKSVAVKKDAARTSSSSAAAAVVDDGEMNNLLSQYLPEPANNTATLPTGSLGESTLMRAAMDNDVVSAAGCHANDDDPDVTVDVPPPAPTPSNDKTLSSSNKTLSAAELRQQMSFTEDQHCSDDTRDMTTNIGDEQTSGIGMFHKLTFTLIGFDADPVAYQLLADMIHDNGGQIPKTARLTDFGVVPVFGCAVKVSVAEVVTNAWLQACVEEGELVPVDSLEIFRPLTVCDGLPLEGCVLSISGYSGIERDVLLQLSQHIGATVQEYFVKRANRGLLPSTHLIVNAAEGSKYTAAKKWNLPAVSKLWLLECARRGRKLSEQLYLIDVQPEMPGNAVTVSDDGRMTTASSEAALKPAQSSSSHSRHHDDEITTKPAQSSVSHLRNSDSKITTASSEAALKPAQSSLSHSRLHDDEITTLDNVRMKPAQPISKLTAANDICSVSAETSLSSPRHKDTAVSNDNSLPSVMQKTAAVHGHDNRLRDGATDTECKDKTIDSRRSDVRPPAVTVTVDFNGDELSAKRMNVGDLKENCSEESPSHSNQQFKKPAPTQRSRTSSATATDLGIDTPGKFLDPAKDFHPSFDLQGVMKLLDSPSPTPGRRPSRVSLPLDEVFSRNLAVAVKNSEMTPDDNEKPTDITQSQDVTSDVQCLQQDTAGPLKGVIIAVCKKLTKNQSEYNSIAASLGADYRWMYDSSCTHFIFQGRQNDTNREFRVARDQGKLIVSPHWLTACQEQGCHVDESLYPHTFNPTLSLNITAQKTPGRLTRNNVRNTPCRPTAAPSVAPADQTGSPVVGQVRSPNVETRSGLPAVARGQTGSPKGPTSSQRPPMGKLHSPAVQKISSDKLRSPASEKSPHPVESSFVKDFGPDVGLERFNTTESDEDIAKVCGQMEDEEKATNTEAIVDNLKRAMEASKASGKQRSAARIHSSNSSTDLSNEASKRDASSIGSCIDTDEKLPRGKQVINTRQRPKPAVTAPTQQSQVVEVVWDDPVAREQRAMLASELEKNSDSFSPPPDTRGVHHTPPAVKDTEAGVANKHQGVTLLRKQSSLSKGSATPSRTVTDGAVAAKSASDTDCQQPPQHQQPQPINPMFLLSGLQPQERESYTALIQRLGGTALDAANYVSECTHLIVGAPTRNEKFLSCIAAGKWVLHKSYLETARRENAFPKEEDYEWGGSSTELQLSSLPEPVAKLAHAARRWRLELSQARKNGKSVSGAFDGWSALLLTDSKREDGFRRLLEAGGATVLRDKKPTSFAGITHAFLDLAKYTPQLSLEEMVMAGVHCIKPEFIAMYLSDVPLPSPSANYIPQVLPFLSADKSKIKRKHDEAATATVDDSITGGKRLRPS